jgi:hypothetical protein
LIVDGLQVTATEVTPATGVLVLEPPPPHAVVAAMRAEARSALPVR